MSQGGTKIEVIHDGLYRIHTPVPPEVVPGGFSFNQYLLVDESPLLVHTGLRGIYEGVSQAIETVLPLGELRYIAFCHYEADECGALNEFLEAAPQAEVLCSQVAAMTSVGDVALRPPRPMADGEEISLGKHVVTWVDAPHVPHGWENGFLFEKTGRTLFCGDLFSQGGSDRPLLADDILEASEQFRKQMDYYAHGTNTMAVLERLARLEPQVLACMHGSAFQGNGDVVLRGLKVRLF